jgi:FkbM family methyltransferase
MRQLLKYVWPSARSNIESIIRWMAARKLPRKTLNIIYNQFSRRQKSTFYAKFAKLFRNCECSVTPGCWSVVFHGREIHVPLREKTMWLDWDCALSVLGHESEIKATYEALISGVDCPRCVFDVGANYGLHSLLFLAHGVEVISFEPNRVCHEHLKRLEDFNQVKFSLESMALGSSERTVELWYPEMDTWLGTIDPQRVREISAGHGSRRVHVPCGTLDGYVRQSNRTPDLIKLDAEGSELDILVGSRETLGVGRPILIFECWRSEGRAHVWRFFDSLDYVTVKLPLLSPASALTLDNRAFSQSMDSNFAALPREKFDS